MRTSRFYYSIFLFISIFLTLIWFVDGKQIAVGEESFSIFNNANILSINGFWAEIGTGFPNATYLLRIIPSSAVKQFLHFGLPLWLIQAFFYLFSFTTGLCGMFLFSKKSLKFSNSTSFWAALFYLFNLFSTFQIWSRFLYSSIALWSLLPLNVYLWSRWLDGKRGRDLGLFVVAHLVFSLAFLQPAHIITLWSVNILWLFSMLYRKKDFSLITIAVIGFAVWVLSNVWWLYPYYVLSGETFDAIANPKKNLDILVSVSQYFKSTNILLLRQKFLLSINNVWTNFYKSGLSYVFNVIILITALLGFKSLYKKKYFGFLALLLVVGWFVSKGSNFPLGFTFFKTLFYTVPATAALRNPYEKFGLVFLLGYSISFGLGISYIRKFEKLRLLLIPVLLSMLVVVWPMLTGDIVLKKKVEVPSYVYEANEFLLKDGKNGRVLVIPATPGDGIAYNWGYVGVEPSEFFFNMNVISKIVRYKYSDDYYHNLSDSVFTRDYDGFKRLSMQGNVKYLMYRKDVVNNGDWADFKKLEKFLKGLDAKVYSFGQIDLYDLGNDTNIIETLESLDTSFKKISPTQYSVNVENLDIDEFTLIFKSSFSKNWVAQIDNEIIDNHNIIYGYANSWIVSKRGKYTIDINFKVWPWE